MLPSFWGQKKVLPQPKYMYYTPEPVQIHFIEPDNGPHFDHEFDEKEDETPTNADVPMNLDECIFSDTIISDEMIVTIPEVLLSCDESDEKPTKRKNKKRGKKSMKPKRRILRKKNISLVDDDVVAMASKPHLTRIISDIFSPGAFVPAATVEQQQAIKNHLIATAHSDAAPELSSKRSSCITGTDIACICNVNPYANSDPKSRFREKALHISIPMNDNMRHGHVYEAVALEKLKYAYIDGVKVKCVFNIKFIQHPFFKYIGGTLDALVELEDGRVFVVEVKCPPKRKIIHGCVPGLYMPQIQSYLLLTGLSHCAFVQYKPPGPRGGAEVFDITMVPADPEFISIRLPYIFRFYLHLNLWNNTCYLWLYAYTRLLQWQNDDRSGKLTMADCSKNITSEEDQDIKEYRNRIKTYNRTHTIKECKALRRTIFLICLFLSVKKRKQMVRDSLELFKSADSLCDFSSSVCYVHLEQNKQKRRIFRGRYQNTNGGRPQSVNADIDDYVCLVTLNKTNKIKTSCVRTSTFSDMKNDTGNASCCYSRTFQRANEDSMDVDMCVVRLNHK